MHIFSMFYNFFHKVTSAFAFHSKTKDIVGKILVTVITATIAVPATTDSLRADTVILRNGNVYKNVRTKVNKGNLEIRGDTNISIPLKDIKSILPQAVIDNRKTENRKSRKPRSQNNDEPERTDSKRNHSPSAVSEPVPNGEPSSNRSRFADDSDSTIWETLAGPLPGLSPYYFSGNTKAGILSGGFEMVALIPAIILWQNPERPGPERYLIYSYILTPETTALETESGNTGFGNQNQPGSKSSDNTTHILMNAMLLQMLDQATFDPVRNPFRSNQYISRQSYLDQRRNALALLSIAILSDTLSFYLFHTDTDDGNKNALRLNLQINIAPNVYDYNSSTTSGITCANSCDRHHALPVTLHAGVVINF